MLIIKMRCKRLRIFVKLRTDRYGETVCDYKFNRDYLQQCSLNQPSLNYMIFICYFIATNHFGLEC